MLSIADWASLRDAQSVQWSLIGKTKSLVVPTAQNGALDRSQREGHCLAQHLPG